ncbi:MAG: 50S ribosomal protein L3 [Chloroflexi bacterium]|nr:50S ribosomal protein L3 [Chloroflexota bacterium]
MLNGLLGTKLGMAQIFSETGRPIGITAIAAGPCTVIQVKTRAKDGYDAVQLGFGPVKRVNAPQKGHLKGLGPFRHLREFRVDQPEDYKVGQVVDVGLFTPGDSIAVIGTSKGRGFAGVVKRHHFSGGPQTHGQSDRPRSPGSIGSNTQPGHVLKNLRMAGHLGDARVTVRRLEVFRVDQERHLLLVKGSVPGARSGLLTINKMGNKKDNKTGVTK